MTTRAGLHCVGERSLRLTHLASLPLSHYHAPHFDRMRVSFCDEMVVSVLRDLTVVCM